MSISYFNNSLYVLRYEYMDKRKEERLFNRQIGKQLKRERKARKIAQYDLAKHLGLHQSAYCRIENGRQGLSLFEQQLTNAYFKRHPIKDAKWLKWDFKVR